MYSTCYSGNNFYCVGLDIGYTLNIISKKVSNLKSPIAWGLCSVI